MKITIEKIVLDLPDSYGDHLVAAFAQAKADINDAKLGAFLNAPEATVTPAESEPAVEATTAPEATKEDMVKALTAVGKRRGRGGIADVLGQFGYKTAAEVKESDYAKVIAEALEQAA